MKVYILAGASGSGKSTMAQQIYASHPQVVICSADDYLYLKGHYVWSPDKLAAAHGECLKKFIGAIQAQAPIVVVDNTNTTVAEMAPYYSIAAAYGAEVQIIICYCNPEKAIRRNTHHTPVSTVLAQAERLGCQTLPSFWQCTSKVVCTD